MFQPEGTNMFRELLLRICSRFRPTTSGTSLDQRNLRLILKTPAIHTESVIEGRRGTAPIGVHILGHDAHLLAALWTLKTFYHYAGVNYPLTVHLQGQNTRQMCSLFRRHFPESRLVTQDAADVVVEPWLQAHGLHRLLAMRRQFFLMMKLIDLRLLARTPFVLYLDTDVLFFRRPDDLMILPADVPAAPHLLMRDDFLSYRITPDRARTDLGVDLVPLANTGVMRLITDDIDLAACERFMMHPDLAHQHWHLEQTLHALNASAQGRLELLPNSYAMSEGLLTTPGLIARHYISPIRPLFVDEGIAHLLEDGFLQALADARLPAPPPSG
jgi:hypothetical protein